MSYMRTDIEDVRCPQNILPGNRVPDVWPALPHLNFPETVFIIASGPTAAPMVEALPPNCFTIACNSAITMPRRFDWWIPFDHRTCLYGWWESINLYHTRKLFGARLVNRLRLQPQLRQIIPDYYFSYMPQILCPTKLHPDWKTTPPEECLVPGLLRGGATVTGVALQFAHYAGAKKIVLIGADFHGRGHFCGEFENPDPYDLYEKRWPYAAAMDSLIAAVKAQGTQVCTLTPTELNLSMWCWV